MNNYKPTDSELEVLQILWQKGPSSVREINELQNKVRPVGYTTTLKIMQIMFEKKLIDRDTSSRSHIYRSMIKELDTKKSLLKEFIDSTFSGSSTKLVLQALGTKRPSKEDLKEIKELIDKLEKEK